MSEQTKRKRKWIGKPSPKSLHQGTGWFAELNKVYVSDDLQYCVMSREISTAWGEVTHICIRNADETDIPWAEKQRIKNELYGEDWTAIEVFPAVENLVDEANMYHLWLLPAAFKLPFGLKGE